MWMRCCCCCCCGRCGADREDKVTALDDASSLISQVPSPEPGHAFYVPRRHSSFQPSTHNPVSTQPGRTHSDCSSSSDDDTIPEQRGRCWSTIPASDVTEFISSRRTNHMRSPVSEVPSIGKFVFDKHALSEIAETEHGEEIKSTPKTDAEVYGYLSFSTCYDLQDQRLTVFLNKAEGLPKKGEEPYATFVKMSLSSSSKHFRLSRAIKKTLSPVYGEQHVFQTNRSRLKSTHRDSVYLLLSVFDSDRQGRHDAIGHALLPLHDLGPEKKDHCLPLSPMSMPVKNLGQILVGLQYVPTQSRLAVHVIKARHLRLDPEVHKRHLRPINRDSVDTFCKVTLTCGGQKVKTCRSRASSGPDPFYDFRANFVVPPQYLRDTGTIVSVVATSTLGRQGATLGRATALGPYVELGEGSATQWGRMIQEGRSIVQWRNIYL